MKKRRMTVGWLWLAAAGFATLVVMLVFVGCGANSASTPPAREQVAGEDEVLFAGGEGEGKSMEGREVPKAPVSDKLLLPMTGRFIHRQLSLGDWERHSFYTKAGKAYQVEICSLTGGDDADLYISRESEISPFGHYWKRSTRGLGYVDGIVFKAGVDAPMYVVVRGVYDGAQDGWVDYTIHARTCSFGTFTQ